VYVKLELEVPDGDLDLTQLVEKVNSAMEGDFARKIWEFATFNDKLITKVEEIHALAGADG
jgi:hypothetical protein